MFRQLTALICALIWPIGSYAADLKTAIVAGGCFWCVEKDFEGVDGVVSAVSGYSGGTLADPTYKQVSKGGTGHYEAVLITYDAEIINYSRLLYLFFRSVDPTDAEGQFCDRGQSYATAVFFADDREERLARRAKASAGAALGQTVVTELLAAGPFYDAEDYHQDYYKSSARVLTRFGWIAKSEAYKKYRRGCGRDKRVRDLWGSAAPFAG